MLWLLIFNTREFQYYYCDQYIVNRRNWRTPCYQQNCLAFSRLYLCWCHAAIKDCRGVKQSTHPSAELYMYLWSHSQWCYTAISQYVKDWTGVKHAQAHAFIGTNFHRLSSINIVTVIVCFILSFRDENLPRIRGIPRGPLYSSVMYFSFFSI